MAMDRDSDRLSDRQIVRLASIVPTFIMSGMSVRYMDTTMEIVEDLRHETRQNELEFNRRIIRRWLNRNPENQRQVYKMNLGTDTCLK